MRTFLQSCPYLTQEAVNAYLPVFLALLLQVLDLLLVLLGELLLILAPVCFLLGVHERWLRHVLHNAEHHSTIRESGD